MTARPNTLRFAEAIQAIYRIAQPVSRLAADHMREKRVDSALSTLKSEAQLCAEAEQKAEWLELVAQIVLCARTHHIIGPNEPVEKLDVAETIGFVRTALHVAWHS